MRSKFGPLVILFAVWASVSVFGQRNDQPVYTTFIGTFVEATAADFEPVKPLGFPYALPIGNNMFRIYMGGFTEKTDAEQAVLVLKSRGYQDSGVLELDPLKGQSVILIQLGTRKVGEIFSWDMYRIIGPLNVMLENNSIKITSGVYKDMNIAKAQLELIRKKGFPDAFIRTVNSVFVHEINAFYPEALYTPPVQPAPAAAEQTIRTVPQDAPQSYNQPSVIPQAKEAPASYSQPVSNYTPPLPAANTSLAPKPSIRANVKRSSVTELQKLLAAGGFYKSSVDGMYGKGTSGAYASAVQGNAQIAKYNMLAEQFQMKSAAVQPGSLQFAIDILADNPGAALPILQEKPLPIAKAYLAYYYLATEGPGQRVNDLMNSAIMEAFIKAVRPPNTRFDYTSSYAYNNLTQLINHLAYVQVVSTPAIQTPCWLLQRHPEDVVRAFTPDPALPKANYSIPDCGGFMEWPEIRTLLSMARDLSAGQQPTAQALADGRVQTLRNIIQPQALPANDQKAVDTWHTQMLAGLRGWSARDVMLADIGNAYQLLYLQSYVLLEDFYMNKGLKAAEAKGLALATLKALVGPYMTRFV